MGGPWRYDRLPIAKIVNAKAISLEQAPMGYAAFDKAIAAKFVLDMHALLAKAA
jgi:glutathione-independent formaldehyde dehydrogenase